MLYSEIMRSICDWMNILFCPEFFLQVLLTEFSAAYLPHLHKKVIFH